MPSGWGYFQGVNCGRESQSLAPFVKLSESQDAPAAPWKGSIGTWIAIRKLPRRSEDSGPFKVAENFVGGGGSAKNRTFLSALWQSLAESRQVNKLSLSPPLNLHFCIYWLLNGRLLLAFYLKSYAIGKNRY